MKIKIIFTSLIICCLSVVPAFATSDISIDSTLSVDEPVRVIIEQDERVDDDLELVSVEETRTTISASDATGLKAIMLDLIGDYETVITDYTYQSGSSGYYSHSISIERDYAWIWSCILFIVVVYCTFRGIGGLIKK